MDCTQMRRVALDGGSLASPEARRHLDDCAACRALFADGLELARVFRAGAKHSDVGPAPSFAALEDAIAHNRGWRTALTELPTRIRWTLAGATLAVPVAVGILLHRHNLAEYPRARFIVELAALGCVAIACCWLWLRPLFKRQPSDGVSWLVSSVALALPLALAALPAALPGTATDLAPKDVLHRAASCLLFGSTIAMPAFLLLVGLGRRPAGPRGLSVMPAAAAALAGIVGLALHCPDASPGHLLVGHAPIVWILPLLLLAVRRLQKHDA